MTDDNEQKPEPIGSPEADRNASEPGERAPNVVSDLPEDQLREFVLGLCDGKIFTTAHVPDPHLWPMVFMPLALGGLAGWTHDELGQIGAIWEWLHEAGPRSINGLPCFFSMRILNRNDWERARKAYETETARRKDIKV